MKIFFLLVMSLMSRALYGLSEGDIKEKVELHAKEYLKRNNASGLAIAVIKNNFEMEEPYHKVFCFGYSKRAQKIPVRESTLFRLGSLSKTFIALILAALLEEGLVVFEQEATHYLPTTFILPKYHGRAFKLIDLLLNTSSLPNMPTMPMKSYQVSWSEVEYYFQKYKLTKAPGTRYEQSNLGYALLGHIISRIKRMPYDRVLSDKVLKPLQLQDTYYSVPLSKMQLLASGHKGLAEVGEHFLDRDGSFFKPTRGLIANIHDIKKWLLFFLKMENSPLDSSLKHIYKNYYIFPEDSSKKEIPGWRLEMLSFKKSLPMYYEAGVYQGFSHCVAFVPDTKTGVAILANSEYDVKQLATTILDLLNN